MPRRERVSDLEDYQSARAEILQWQGFRLTLFTASAAVVTGVLGIMLGGSGNNRLDQWWFVASFLLLVFLGCVAWLTWYAGAGNVKMGTYVRVFHEHDSASVNEPGGRWHVRHRQLKDVSKDKNVRDLAAQDSESEGYHKLRRKIQALFLKWSERQHLDRLLAIPYIVLGFVSLVLPWVRASTEGQHVLPPVPWMVPIMFGVLWFAIPVFLLCLKSPSWYYAPLWNDIKHHTKDNQETG